jgi:hypothetical protein
MPRTFQADTPLQALILGQALAMARQLERTSADAPDGKVLAAVEAAARELARTAVEVALQAQAAAAEKGGHPAAPARGAARPPGPSGGPPATS